MKVIARSLGEHGEVYLLCTECEVNSVPSLHMRIHLSFSAPN